MAMLVGKHVNKIDKKGRVSVPKPFRDALSDPELDHVYVYASFKYPAIEGCGEDIMKRLAESIEELELFSDDQDDMASIIIEGADILGLDPEGRVVLPEEMRTYAGISDQALFVGRGNGMFQIWNPETYKKHRGSAIENARARGATLKLRRRDGE